MRTQHERDSPALGPAEREPYYPPGHEPIDYDGCGRMVALGTFYFGWIALVSGERPWQKCLLVMAVGAGWVGFRMACDAIARRGERR